MHSCQSVIYCICMRMIPEILFKDSHTLGAGMLQRVAHERWGTAGPVERIFNNRWFIACVRAGAATVQRDDQAPCQLRPPAVLVMTQPSRYRLDISQPVDLWIVVAEGERADVLLEHHLCGLPPVTTVPDMTLAEDISGLLRVAREGGPWMDARCDLLVEAMVLGLRTRLMQVMPRPQDGSLACYARIKDVADRQACHLANVTAWAAACGIDRSHLSRLVRRHAGRTAIAYLNERKLQTAADLLLDSADSIGAIASTVGYADPFTFSKAFRRRFGMAPRRYRQRW